MPSSLQDQLDIERVKVSAKNVIFVGKTEARSQRAYLYLGRRVQNALVMGAGDTLAFGIALLLAGVACFWWLGELPNPTWSWYLLISWWCGAGLVGLLPSWGLGPVEELRRITVLLIAIHISAGVVLFLSNKAWEVSHLTLMLSLTVSVFAVPLIRLRVKRWLISLKCWSVPTVVYGTGQMPLDIVNLLRQEQGLGYDPIGIFDDEPSNGHTTRDGVPVLGDTDAVDPRAPIAILAMPGISQRRLTQLLDGPLSMYCTILIIPDLLNAPSLWVRPRDLQGVLGLEITYNLAKPLARFVKRTTDIMLVLLLAPLWLPICGALAFLIWREDWGNPFFMQERVGKDRRLFKTWKFRTMYLNAEEVLHHKLAEDPALRQEWEVSYKLKQDPRVTRIGAFLRRYSLDELPQVLNVLRGDMSLVGPRPLPPYHHGALPEWVCGLRERVRPGITGLWQVSGRSDAGMDGMVQWDPFYVRNWSVWLDLIVLIRTTRAVLTASGAY